MAVYLLSSELDRRLAMMQASARSMVEAPVGQRNRAWQRSQDMLGGRVPDLLVVLKDDGDALFPSDGRLAAPPDGWGEVSGIVSLASKGKGFKTNIMPRRLTLAQ